MSTVSRARARVRARGHGHRRRYSQAHASRSSVYETIEEEMSNASSPARTIGSKMSSPTQCQPIFVVESDTASINSVTEETIWDDERGIVALRKYYALKDEAHVTVVESKRQWLDTPFSVFALQCKLSCLIVFMPRLNQALSVPTSQGAIGYASPARVLCAELWPAPFRASASPRTVAHPVPSIAVSSSTIAQGHYITRTNQVLKVF
jgi:hypothetical protein